MDDVTAAYNLLRCLDLTSLNANDSEYKIASLCEKANSTYGKTAAVCVYPKFVPLAKEELNGSGINIATVVNFPEGENNITLLQKEIEAALKYGANEIDAVFPYKEYLNKNFAACQDYVKTAKSLCGKKIPLKLILETGEIKKALLIKDAAKIGIENGADFIKTSTGKTQVSATPEAANAILETITSAKSKAGFKASGGIKTLEEAKKYMVLASSIMGGKWITPQNFRIGASSLLDDLINVIKRGY